MEDVVWLHKGRCLDLHFSPELENLCKGTAYSADEHTLWNHIARTSSQLCQWLGLGTNGSQRLYSVYSVLVLYIY